MVYTNNTHEYQLPLQQNFHNKEYSDIFIILPYIHIIIIYKFNLLKHAGVLLIHNGNF